MALATDGHWIIAAKRQPKTFDPVIRTFPAQVLTAAQAIQIRVSKSLVQHDDVSRQLLLEELGE